LDYGHRSYAAFHKQHQQVSPGRVLSLETINTEKFLAAGCKQGRGLRFISEGADDRNVIRSFFKAMGHMTTRRADASELNDASLLRFFLKYL
jgi:outer membrane PBP1 activator LpoA protein